MPRQPRITSVDEWLSMYEPQETTVEDRPAVVLFKATGPDYRPLLYSNAHYLPGTTPVLPDWDPASSATFGPGALHFAATPGLACFGRMPYPREDLRFLAVPVWVDDLRPALCVPHIRARGACAPIWEVDENEQPLERAPSNGCYDPSLDKESLSNRSAPVACCNRCDLMNPAGAT